MYTILRIDRDPIAWLAADLDIESVAERASRTGDPISNRRG